MKLFLAVTLVIIAISIACSSSKSAESSAAQVSNAPTNQPAISPTGSAIQDKTSCDLKLSQAPLIFGFKLGMTPDEVLVLFPGAKDDPEVRAKLSLPANQFGTSNFAIKTAKYENKDKFPGVNQISFNLLDGRVYNFSVRYDGPQWPHVDNFVAKFVEGKDLPPVDQWQPYVGMDNLKMLKCADFEVRVFAGGEGGNLNYVQMQDLVADKKLKERRKKALELEQASPTPGNQ